MNNCTALSPSRAASIRVLSSRASFLLLASITVSFLAGSLAPTPLYPVYQAEWGFSALTTTEIFAINHLRRSGVCSSQEGSLTTLAVGRYRLSPRSCRRW